MPILLNAAESKVSLKRRATGRRLLGVAVKARSGRWKDRSTNQPEKERGS